MDDLNFKKVFKGQDMTDKDKADVLEATTHLKAKLKNMAATCDLSACVFLSRKNEGGKKSFEVAVVAGIETASPVELFSLAAKFDDLNNELKEMIGRINPEHLAADAAARGLFND